MSLFQFGRAFPVLPAKGVAHTATVIFLHGLGDTGLGWSMGLEEIRRKDVEYLCPTAPVQAVSLNYGFQMPSWFDIHGLQEDSQIDMRGLESASNAVMGLIENEVSKGIDVNRIVLGGFSQGGALALFTYLTMGSSMPALAGVVAFSTWLPKPKDDSLVVTAKSKTPIFQCHGSDDEIVPFARGKQTAELLKSFGQNVTFKEYRGMGHHSSLNEMEDLRTFLDSVIPPV